MFVIVVRTHAEEGVRTAQARPRKLRHLYRCVIAHLSHKIDWLGNVYACDGSSGRLDEIVTQHFANEGERARRAQVALDHPQLSFFFARGAGLADNLHIERTGDVEASCHLLRDLLEARHVGLQKGERRKDEGRIAGVYTCVFHMF